MSFRKLIALASQTGPSFDEEFRGLHHFSKHPPFSSRPSTFAEFRAYCEGLERGVQPNGENEQTIARAVRYLELLSTGQGKDSALTQAWEAFPVLRS